MECIETIARKIAELIELADHFQEEERPVMLVYLLNMAMAEVDELRRRWPTSH